MKELINSNVAIISEVEFIFIHKHGSNPLFQTAKKATVCNSVKFSSWKAEFQEQPFGN